LLIWFRGLELRYTVFMGYNLQNGKHDEDDTEDNSDDNDAGDDDDGVREDNIITILAICGLVALSWLG